MNTSTERAIGAHGHGKDIVDGLNARYKIYLGKQMNRLSKSLIIAFKDLVILHSDSNISTFSFAEQCKDILTETSLILGNIDHSKMKR